jgi:hypothetical protein
VFSRHLNRLRVPVIRPNAAPNTFLAAIPSVVGALLIIIIGWMSVGVLARVTTEVLRRAGADRLFAQHGGERLRARSEGFRPSLVAGELAKWLIRIVILVAAANVLGMTQVSELLSQIVLWIPNPIVAVVTLLVAPLLARFVRGAIEVGAGEMGFTKPRSWVGLPRLRLSRLPWSSPSTRSASPPT